MSRFWSLLPLLASQPRGANCPPDINPGGLSNPLWFSYSLPLPHIGEQSTYKLSLNYPNWVSLLFPARTSGCTGYKDSIPRREREKQNTNKNGWDLHKLAWMGRLILPKLTYQSKFQGFFRGGGIIILKFPRLRNSFPRLRKCLRNTRQKGTKSRKRFPIIRLLPFEHIWGVRLDGQTKL